MVVQIRTSQQQQQAKMTEIGHQQQKVEANILVLGAENVGKSALTVRFLTRRFIGEYVGTESIYTHNVLVDGRETFFSIWDSVCPQNPNLQTCVCEEQLRWADGFILVYSICDRDSFNVVRQQLQRIRQLKKRQGSAPIIIVGNKRDLQHRREVSSEEGRMLAISSDCGFFEISAAETYHGSLVVFHQLLESVRENRSANKKNAGIKGIVRSMSAVFGRKRTE
ncbi:PREDICTED: ras-related and estrogen-regulated growth inhibitor-like protein [Nanorana parkeri]|uniref:ras-related and estrogen-regulated growth inhibitor-like protein n=1 Tax=Nanorana parkeri TaxID=125878 RepID=UPI000854D015|nr:PREDICTED: ras-related and estrogen-regulated growth inhibitor-like protein [Nanorana parkeri]